VVDERPLVRDLLGQALAGSSEFDVAVIGGSRDKAVHALKGAKPATVAIIAAAAIDTPVDRFIESLMLASPWVSVLVLVSDESDHAVLQALEAGALGFIADGTPLEEVKERVRAAAARQTVLPAEFAQRLLAQLQTKRRSEINRVDRPQLTEREHEILALLTTGLGNAEIATELGVSPNTVKNHLYSIYRKLGVTSRGQAFATATKLGIAV
jgi:DNA-binding NarL/FixJ family response regulator